MKLSSFLPLVALIGATSLLAQTPAAPASAPAAAAPAAPRLASTGGRSAHETTSAVIDGNRVMIVYGRPTSKNPRTGEVRKYWGTLVPYGKIWRTGSDEATLLVTQQAIEMGGVTIPAGAYTLWTLPAEDGSAKLIVNKQIGQWGVPRPNQDAKEVYDEGKDVVRVDMKKAPLATPVDQFTMSVAKDPNAATGGVIKLAWEGTEYSAPFSVKK